MKCRKEHLCKWGMTEDEDGEFRDVSDKDPRRCTKCIMTKYSLFEPYDEDDEES